MLLTLIHTVSLFILTTIDNLRNFHLSSLFDLTIWRIMVESNHNHPEIQKLQNAFWHLDINCDGLISAGELVDFLKSYHDELDEAEALHIFKNYSKKNPGDISCTEFVMAAMERSFYYEHEHLHNIFRVSN